MKFKYFSFLIKLLLIVFLITGCATRRKVTYRNLTHPKREFRATWISTAWQSRYRTMSASEMKSYLSAVLDTLKNDGFNAVIFQVRPAADAFYKSRYEPWSRYLSGEQGVAPDHNFDPLAYLVEESHKRCMELHAWINPYRVTLGLNDELVSNHIYYKHPERFIKYGGKIYFDPGLPENRQYICKIVEDILLHYDVDAIHMDDYFYPYPIVGESFNDAKSFALYGRKDGFSKDRLLDWRRNNVNKLVKDIKQTILLVKPWVRLGIAPFGIYRNYSKTYSKGSKTQGLECYNDLSSDITLWLKKKWVDYVIPEIYWEIGCKYADYSTLVTWWNNNSFKQPLYIGEDIKRTMNVNMPLNPISQNGFVGKDCGQLNEKMLLARSKNKVKGYCFWSVYDLMDNYHNIQSQLKNKYFRYPALIPAYTNMDKTRPLPVNYLSIIHGDKSDTLKWVAKNDPDDPQTAKYYVVYRFAKSQKVDLENAVNIVSITIHKYYKLPISKAYPCSIYVVTAVNAFHNESKGTRIIMSSKIKE